MKNSLTILFLVMAVFAYAQRQNISGKVTDSTGGVLPGVTVVVKGTTAGTITDINGTYSLQAAANAKTLVFSFVGMKTQEVDIAGRVVIDISLTEESVELDEVVAVGYGTMRKSDITGSVASVRADELSRAGTIGIDQALAGKASGVMVTQSSGVPGAGAFIKIRGINSMRGSDPLYIIDGVPLDNTNLSTMNSEQEASSQISPLSTINASDIESIEILKDASATAIYGSRGANGVIIITTKSGKAGLGKIEVIGEYGISNLPYQIELQDGNDYWLTVYEANFNANSLANVNMAKVDSARAGLFPTINWQDAVFRQGKTQNYNLNLSGGTNDIKYLVSTNLFDAEGIVKKSDFTRVSGRINLDARVNKSVNLGTRINYAAIKSNQVNTTTNYLSNFGTNSIIMRALVTSPTTGLGAVDDDFGVEYYLPSTALEANNYENFISQFIGSMFLNFKLSKALSFKTDFSYQIRNANQRFYQKNLLPKAYSRSGWAKTNDSRVRLYSTTNTLNYAKKFGKHRLDAVLGQSIEWFDNTAVITSNYGFANDILTYFAPQTALFMDPDAVQFSDSRLVSLFARANYSYADKFLMTFTGRADGSSKFAENNKFGYFPAVALGYRVSEEDFMKDMANLSNLKLRVSYGLSGNQAIQPYQSLDQYASNKQGFGNGSGGESFSPIYYPSQLPNPDLKWEQTAQLNAGLDFGLWGNRLSANIDYYNKQTSNLLVVGNRIPAHSGFTAFTENLGLMESNGFDFGLNVQIIEKADIKWNVNGILSTGKTKIKEMGVDYIESGYNQGWVTGGTQRLIIGEEIGAFYGYKRTGISQFEDFQEFQGLSMQEMIDLYSKNPMAVFTPIVNKNGNKVIALRPGEQLHEDVDGNGLINELDRQIIGYAQPDVVFGFNSSLTYKNFEFNFNIDGQLGQDVCNVTNFQLLAFDNRQQLKLVRQRWSPDQPSQVYPRLYTGNTGAPSFKMSDRFLEDGSFVRIQNVTLAYNLSSSMVKKLNVSNAKVFISGSNLLTLTEYSGYNPDISLNGNNTQQMGHDNAGYPVARSFRFGINLQF
jgi:TonB-dependent starch-binding outer membrane protein SusC